MYPCGIGRTRNASHASADKSTGRLFFGSSGSGGALALLFGCFAALVLVLCGWAAFGAPPAPHLANAVAVESVQALAAAKQLHGEPGEQQGKGRGQGGHAVKKS